MTTPIYSQLGDPNNLYSYISGKKIVDPDIPVQISLTDGYKTSDIKNVIIDYDEMLIEFNDKSIYYAENMGSESYSIEKDEELSRVNQEGKILDMHIDGGIIVLMNNNKVYIKR